MNYISKEEKKIPIDDPTGKWSDLTLLPEWEEEFYDVYTVKKYGKWVMLKTLKKEYADDPKCRKMLENEFDTRYNLAHANIVMVNDLEEVPGIGRAIITDDAYGYSLRRLIDEKRLTPKIVYRLQTQLLDALQYIEENHIIHHPITPEKIIFTEYSENLKLLDIGYDHTDSLTPQDTAEDIRNYGKIISEVLDNLPTKLPKLRRIADKCTGAAFDSIGAIKMAMWERNTGQIFLFISIIILFLCCVLIWLAR